MATYYVVDSPEDSDQIRKFARIDFLEPESGAPFLSYVYPSARCGEGVLYGDDALCVYERSDGTEERLFVESSERPFYLDRDAQDGDLARVVITFVPREKILQAGR